MTEYRFTWDPAKAAANFRKHGIAFEDAVAVFADPQRLTRQDRIEGGEYRWQTTGAIRQATLVLVAHADSDDAEVTFVRIISARLAARHERKSYERKDG